MKQIIGIGNALVDALYPVGNDHILDTLNLPKGTMQLIDQSQYAAISERMKNERRELTTGGSACNTILALAHLGAPTALIGKVSNDDYGRFFADHFRNLGVTPYLINSDLPSGVATTFITPDGQRTFATFLGAAATLNAEEIQQEWMESYSYIYIEGYLVQNHSLIEHTVKAAHNAGLLVCLDLASFNIVEADRDFFAQLLANTDIVFANEDEARAFTGKEPREALDILAQICPVAVVKVGKEGAMAKQGDLVGKVPAGDAPKAIDTTAAGDYFAAGFLYAHAKGRTLQECLSAGTVLANEIIQVVGTRLEDDTWQKIKKIVC